MSSLEKEMFAESAHFQIIESRFHRMKLVFELLRYNCFRVIRYKARSSWLFSKMASHAVMLT